jgi:hypothetical protein
MTLALLFLCGFLFGIGFHALTHMTWRTPHLRRAAWLLITLGAAIVVADLTLGYGHTDDGVVVMLAGQAMLAAIGMRGALPLHGRDREGAQ